MYCVCFVIIYSLFTANEGLVTKVKLDIYLHVNHNRTEKINDLQNCGTDFYHSTTSTEK